MHHAAPLLMPIAKEPWREVLQAEPFSHPTLLVWADALLDAGDLRGERLRSMLVGTESEAAAALEDSKQALFETFGNRPLLLTDGVLDTVIVGQNEWPEVAACWSEPLLTMSVRCLASSKRQTFEKQMLWPLAQAHPFGLTLTGGFSVEGWLALIEALASISLKKMTLSGVEISKEMFEVLCSQRGLGLQSVGFEAMDVSALSFATALIDNVSSLSFRHCRGVPVQHLLSLPSLRAIDLRGVPLTLEEREALQHWPHAASHETLPRVQTPPRQWVVHPLYFPKWRIARQSPLTALVQDDTVRLFADDTPSRVAAMPQSTRNRPLLGLSFVDATGVLHMLSDGGQAQPRLMPPETLYLAQSSGGQELAVGTQHKCVLMNSGRTFYFEAKKAVFSEDGACLTLLTLDGALRTFSVDSGEAMGGWNPPFRIEDVYSTNEGLVAFTLDEAWLLNRPREEIKMVFSHFGQLRLKAAAGGSFVAALLSPWSVRMARVDGSVVREAAWSQTFDRPEGEALWIDDIAMTEGGVLVVALSSGALTLIDCETGLTRTAEPFAGEAPRRWTFLVGSELQQVNQRDSK